MRKCGSNLAICLQRYNYNTVESGWRQPARVWACSLNGLFGLRISSCKPEWWWQKECLGKKMKWGVEKKMEGEIYTGECIAGMLVSDLCSAPRLSIVSTAGKYLYPQHCHPFSGHNREWLVALIFIMNSLPWYHFAISDLQVQETWCHFHLLNKITKLCRL